MYIILSKSEPRGLSRGKQNAGNPVKVTKVQLPQTVDAPPEPGEETDYEVALQKALDKLTAEEGVEIVQVLWRPARYE